KRLADLDAVADTTQLRQIVRRIRQQGDVEQARSGTVDALEKIEQESGVRLAQLGLWSGSLDELERLSVPSDETVDRFDQQIRDLDARLAGLHDRRAAEEEAVAELQTRTRQLELGQAIPTEEDLDAARQRRQEGWRLVRRALEEGHGDGPDVEAFLESLDAADLADAYQRSVDRADGLADRLRREADRVTGKAKLQADRDRAQERWESLDEEIRAAENDAARLSDQWTGLWTPLGIAPRLPREMRSWLRRHSELVDLAADAREHRGQAERQAKQIDAERGLLADCLKSFGADTERGEPLAAMVDRADQLIDHAAEQQTTWDRLRQTLDNLHGDRQDAEAEHEESRQELAAWQGEWAAAIRYLGLEQDATAAQANVVISTINELFGKLHDADQTGLRISGIDHDKRHFADDVQAIAERLAPELAGRPVEDSVAALSSKLTEARAARERRQSLSQQQTRHTEAVDQAKAAISTADAQLTAMCEQAGCRHHEELPDVQQRSDRRRELESELQAAESEILSHSAGAPLDNFVEQAEAVDADMLESRIQELDERIHRLEQELTEANQQIGSERAELAAMDGNPRAAEKAEACENLAAQLEEDVREYAVSRLASAVLREAVERYREKNQGPILDRAGRLFADVTGGSFEGLRGDFDARGEPVLMGVRPGTTETIGLEAMSDGTCDQLYLALRIASIENWLESHESIPFIVDDVLLNFDNARAAATLGALADLSRRTQVVFFTHHEHLVAMAQDRLADDTLFTHRL
ncbi:MAG: hypothetical protein HQ582_09255, partial [Planctomycetes bacterium]|nr:hypothetical protein [Planctomycetota bacterium]